MDRLDIAVVGCGPSGMAAALFLAADGHRPRILERFAAPAPVGSGLLLQPTGLAVLDRLGLGAAARGAAARIAALRGHSAPSGRTILDVAYGDLVPGLCGHGIHRAALFAILHEAVARAGIPVATGADIRATGEGAGGRLLLVAADGRRHGPFDLVVDASGAGSALRAAAGGRPARPFAYGALWTTVPLGAAPADCLYQGYWRASEMVGLLPLGPVPGRDGPQAALFWSIRRDAVAAWRQAGLAAWRQAVAARFPFAAPHLAAIPGPEAMSLAAYAHFTAPRPFAGRLALIGDAAHSTSPQLGQGANMGLTDAFVLARALRRHGDLRDALAAYAAARRRHVRFFQLASRLMTPLFQSDSRLAAALRDAGLPLIHRVRPFRREMVRMLAGLKVGPLAGFDPERDPFPDG